MPAVTLGDIAKQLSSFEKVTTTIENINENVAAIRGMFDGLLTTLQSNGIVSKDKPPVTLRSIASGVKGMGSSDKKDEKLEVLKNIYTVLSGISGKIDGKKSGSKLSFKGAGNFSDAIRNLAETVVDISGINPLKAKLFSITVDIIEKPILKLYGLLDSKNFKNVNEKKAQSAAKTLSIVSGAILDFSKDMALVALLAIPAALGTLAAYPIILLANGLFTLLSKSDRNAKQGAITLGILSVSLLAFTVNMALTMVLTSAMFGAGKVTPENILGTVAVFGIAATTLGIFTLINVTGKPAKNGAITLGFLSLSLLAFSVSFVLSNMILDSVWTKRDKNGESTGEFNFGAIGTVAVFGLALGTLYVFNKIGGSKMSKNSKNGAITLGFLSLSLLAFSVSFVLSNMILDSVWTKRDKNGESTGEFNFGAIGTIAVFGLALGMTFVMKTIGKSWKSAAKGAGVMLLMSVSLIVFSYGFKQLNSEVSKTSWEDLGKVAAVIAGIGAEFAIAGLGPVPLAIAAGAIALGLAGAALIPFGIAFEKFTGSISKVTPEQLNTILGTKDTPGIISRMITAMYSAFNDTSAKSILKATAAIPSALALSASISMLAGGIATFAELETNGVADKWDDKGNPIHFRPFNLDAIVSSIQKIVNVIPDVFIPIGEKGTPKNARSGLETVRGFSTALSILATGITGFGLIYSKGIPLMDKDGKIVDWVKFDQKAIIDGLCGTGEKSGLLTALQDAFRIVGEQSTTELSIPKFLGGGKLNLPDKEVINGFLMVGGIGNALLNLSTSMQNFANIQTMKDANGKHIDLNQVTSSIETLLTVLPTAFKSLNEEDFEFASEISEEYFQENSPILSACKNVTNELSNLKPIDTTIVTSLTESITKIGNALTQTEKSGLLGGALFYEIINDTLPTIGKFTDKSSTKFIDMMSSTAKSINSIDMDKLNGLKGLYDSMATIAKMRKSEFNTMTDRIVEAAENIVKAIMETGGTQQTKTVEVKTNNPSVPTKIDVVKQQPQPTPVIPTVQPPQEVRIYLNDIENNGNGWVIIPK